MQMTRDDQTRPSVRPLSRCLLSSRRRRGRFALLPQRLRRLFKASVVPNVIPSPRFHVAQKKASGRLSVSNQFHHRMCQSNLLLARGSRVLSLVGFDDFSKALIPGVTNRGSSLSTKDVVLSKGIAWIQGLAGSGRGRRRRRSRCHGDRRRPSPRRRNVSSSSWWLPWCCGRRSHARLYRRRHALHKG